MLKNLNMKSYGSQRWHVGGERTEDHLLDRVFSVLRRRYGIALLALVACVGGGLLFLHFATPFYTSSTYLLIDSRRVSGLEESSVDGPGQIDDSMVDSQVQVILSENSLLKVVDKLDLVNHPTFQDPVPLGDRVYADLVGLAARADGLLERTIGVSLGIEAWMPEPPPPAVAPDAADEPLPAPAPAPSAAPALPNQSSPFANAATAAPGTAAADFAVPAEGTEAFLRRRLALYQVLDNVNVRRIGRTYVLNIDYTSADPELAARIANAIAEQYLTDQLDSKYEAMQRAGDWLQERIAELRQQSLDADAAVQAYRAANNLITAGGLLIDEQQLGELNTELVKVRSDTAQAEARYARIMQILENGDSEAAVQETIDNPVVSELRSKYLEAARRREFNVQRLGDQHQAVIQLDQQMAEYERQIFAELGRVAETYRSDYDIARNKEASLERSLATMVQQNAQSNESQVTLRELEREAETFRNIYTTFLQRYQQTLQQQSFPITEARIITRAVPAERQSAPNVNLVLTAASFLGLLIGAGLAGLSEFKDRVFRSGSQIRQELGFEFFGMLWEAKGKRLSVDRKPAANGERRLRLTNSIYRTTVDHPAGASAETMRSVKLAADLAFHDQTCKVIGIVSVLPGEGKTTVAKNLASLLAVGGAKTLLIDADMRNPSLTRSVAPHARSGLVEYITRNVPVEEVIYTEDDTGLQVVPCVAGKRLFHTNELIASPRMVDLFKWAREEFDYVICDLSPLAPVVDARVLERMIDGFVLVVHWGSTPRRLVRNVTAEEQAISEKALGAILNRADPKRTKAFQSSEDRERYMDKYTNYYLEGRKGKR